MTKYVMLNNRFEHKAGTIVYKALGPDYGIVRDDTNYTGIEHIAVTLNEEGKHPFFTIPVDHLSPFVEKGMVLGQSLNVIATGTQERVLSTELFKLAQAAGPEHSQVNSQWLKNYTELIVKECADFVQFYYIDHSSEVIAHDMKSYFRVK